MTGNTNHFVYSGGFREISILEWILICGQQEYTNLVIHTYKMFTNRRHKCRFNNNQMSING